MARSKRSWTSRNGRLQGATPKTVSVESVARRVIELVEKHQAPWTPVQRSRFCEIVQDYFGTLATAARMTDADSSPELENRYGFLAGETLAEDFPSSVWRGPGVAPGAR